MQALHEYTTMCDNYLTAFDYWNYQVVTKKDGRYIVNEPFWHRFCKKIGPLFGVNLRGNLLDCVGTLVGMFDMKRFEELRKVSKYTPTVPTNVTPSATPEGDLASRGSAAATSSPIDDINWLDQCPTLDSERSDSEILPKYKKMMKEIEAVCKQLRSEIREKNSRFDDIRDDLRKVDFLHKNRTQAERLPDCIYDFDIDHPRVTISIYEPRLINSRSFTFDIVRDTAFDNYPELLQQIRARCGLAG